MTNKEYLMCHDVELAQMLIEITNVKGRVCYITPDGHFYDNYLDASRRTITWLNSNQNEW